MPFAAGGSTGVVSRLVAAPLAERLGQPIVVENRPGGAGIIGADAATKTAPDGHTLVIGSLETYGITPAAAKRLPYNPEKDLAPIVLVAFVRGRRTRAHRRRLRPGQARQALAEGAKLATRRLWP